MKKIFSFEKICVAFSLIAFIWLVSSFMDVNMHNMTDQKYASWNLFTMFSQDENVSEQEDFYIYEGSDENVD